MKQKKSKSRSADRKKTVSRHAANNHYPKSRRKISAEDLAAHPYKRKAGRPAAKRTVEGVFSATRHGYGFLTVTGEKEDFFVPAPKTGGALHGDRVRAVLRKSRGERAEAEITEILSYGKETVIGTLCSERVAGKRRGGKYFVRRFLLPDSDLFPEIEVQNTALPDGEKAEVTVVRGKAGTLTGSITRSFGSCESRTANYEAILAENGIPAVFPDDVLAEAAQAAAEPLSDAGRNRPREIIFTIDGADAKDLDDAISLTKIGDAYRLGVHIADVSHYVKRHSACEKEAMARGTSVYFVDKVVPMLPEILSNGACSLNAGEDKYAISAYITFEKNGEIKNTEVRRSIIRSTVRGVYSEVNDLLLKGGKSAFFRKYEKVYPTLLEMRDLYTLLAKRGRHRGIIDFDRPEGIVLLDENGDPYAIEKRERGIAERMIEQFMLAANTGIATALHAAGFPAVYRVHDKPDPDRVRDFVAFADALGLDTAAIREGEGKTPVAFANLLRSAQKRGIGDTVSYVLLRTMAKAKYSAETHGHFGLAIRYYCHFTSPIRRLSDLVTHRLVKQYLIDKDPENQADRLYARDAATAATEGEIRALTAEREIENLYKTLYMINHIGEEYEATVSGLTSFGIFAELDNTCEGMIPFTAYGHRYVYDERRQIIVGPERTFRFGDRIRVRVEEADLINRKVKFALLQ